ncbi:MAG TPA: PEP-CTERM sorting domain-containing protein [Bryobacteraceae bacterium]|jgi:hypothetical protein
MCQLTYDTGGLAPDNSLLEGTVTFDLIAVNMIEQPVNASATPEPPTIALLGLGVGMLIFAAYKREGRQSVHITTPIV